MHYVYMVLCGDGSLYCGWTTNVEKRLTTHNAGKGARYTRARLPVTLVLTQSFDDKGDALRRERTIKRMARSAKLELIAEAGAAHGT